ncbi:MAG: hypothetical protein ACXVFV_09795, partial [Mycobacteriales bacterium]
MRSRTASATCTSPSVRSSRFGACSRSRPTPAAVWLSVQRTDSPGRRTCSATAQVVATSRSPRLTSSYDADWSAASRVAKVALTAT